MISDMADIDASPMGCTWQRYLEHLVAEHGGWTALTRLLVQRAGPSAGLPIDPGTIERGLRRLRTRGNAPGGQYGHWLLHHFEVPRPLEDTAKWMGQYHGRFADLPVSLCQSQLWLWDRPPIIESAAAGWIHLGLGSVALRRRDLGGARLRLQRARASTDPAAQIESALLAARLEMDAGQPSLAENALAEAQVQIRQLPDAGERDCYHARWADQSAYQLIHAGSQPELPRAVALYRSINARSPAVFALFRRNHGLAYCHWKLGDHDQALQYARAALDHAGDAGLLRFRVMALQLLAHIEPAEAPGLRLRADRIIAELEHSAP
jgi:tetratricopeptide (TPR) repeat protein